MLSLFKMFSYLPFSDFSILFCSIFPQSFISAFCAFCSHSHYISFQLHFHNSSFDTHSFSLTHTCTYTHTHTCTHKLLFLSINRTLSLSLTNTHSHSLSHTHPHTHSSTPSHAFRVTFLWFRSIARLYLFYLSFEYFPTTTTS